MKVIGILVNHNNLNRYYKGIEEDELVCTFSHEKAKEFYGVHDAEVMVDILRDRYPQNKYFLIILGA
jgi:hypothetical protein